MDRQRPASNRVRRHADGGAAQEKTAPSPCKGKMGPETPGHNDDETPTERGQGTAPVLRGVKHDSVCLDKGPSAGMDGGEAEVLELTVQDLDDILQCVLSAVDALQSAVDRATVARQAAQDAAAIARGLLV